MTITMEFIDNHGFWHIATCDSKEKAESAFYVDVTSEGFYPINLIFRNDTKDRVIVLSCMPIRIAPIIVRFCRLWVYLNGFIVIGNRLIILTFMMIGYSPINVRRDTLRIYLKNVSEIRDRLIILAFSLIGNSTIVADQAIAGVYLKGFVEITDGLIIVTL